MATNDPHKTTKNTALSLPVQKNSRESMAQALSGFAYAKRTSDIVIESSIGVEPDTTKQIYSLPHEQDLQSPPGGLGHESTLHNNQNETHHSDQCWGKVLREIQLPGSAISFIRLKNSAFSQLSNHAYTINRKRTKNPALDHFLGGVLKLFEDYAAAFLLERELTFSSQDCLVEAWDPKDPFFIIIFARSASELVDEATVESLRQVLLEFSTSILEFGADIFSPPSTHLNDLQRSFVQEAAEDYLRRHKNQTITAPFECSFPNSSLQSLPIQGKIKPALSDVVDSSDEVFLAVSDGVKADDLSIFLRKLNETGQPQKDNTDIYTAEQENQLRIAAEAFLEPIKAVEVTVCKRRDLKGVVRCYVKNIRPVNMEEFQTIIAGSQLAL